MSEIFYNFYTRPECIKEKCNLRLTNLEWRSTPKMVIRSYQKQTPHQLAFPHHLTLLLLNSDKTKKNQPAVTTLKKSHPWVHECLSAAKTKPIQSHSSNEAPSEAQIHVLPWGWCLDSMPKDKVSAGVHKTAPYPREETLTQENHGNTDSDQQITASRTIKTEVYLQMEKLSC